MDRENCWRKVSPLILAVACLSAADVAKVPEQAAELLHLSGRPDDKDSEMGPGVDLDLPFSGQRKLTEARPDKETGKIKPEHLEKDGVTPKKFVNDDFAFLPELLIDASRKGFRIVEAPIRFTYRVRGVSKMDLATTSRS